MMHSLPLVYCPEGVAPPAWLADPVVPMAVTAGPSDTGPGKAYGGALDPSAPGDWRHAKAGWWVRLCGHRPQHFQRSLPHPRIREWRAISGDPGDTWLVPVILKPTDAGVYAIATDQRWGDDGWGEPAELSELIRRLLAIQSAAPLGLSPEEEEALIATTAAMGLGLGMHLDLHLLAVTGWLTDTLAARIIQAMAGLPVEGSCPLP